MESGFQKYGWLSVILMAISALFWPFWLTVAIFCISCFVFRTFYPGLVILFVMDAIYGLESIKLFPVYGIISISAIVVYVAIFYLKEKIVISHQ